METLINSTKTEWLLQKANTFIPGCVHSPVRAFKSVGEKPFITESANGAILKTVEGKELIDYVGGWGTAIHGHNHPVIKAAILEALEKGTNFGTENEYGILLSEKIASIMPSVEKIRMVNSGTEATMSAIRLARGYTGRNKIIKFAGCYHGHFDGLLVKAGSGALTCGHPDSAGVPKGYAMETIVLPLNNEASLEQAFQEHGEDLAAVIIEAYTGNCGFILPKEGYLKKIRELCTQNKTIFIMDEVMTGFRIALGGVQERENISPDLSALGKIIGGGLPVGAFGGKREIMDCLAPEGPVYQAGTLSGNPLAMAAGMAALSLLEDSPPYAYLDNLGKRLETALKKAANSKGIPIQIPRVGSMFSIFFSETPVHNYENALASQTHLFKKLFAYCFKKGIFLPPSPFETCFISTAHTQEIIDKTIECICEAFKKF